MAPRSLRLIFGGYEYQKIGETEKVLAENILTPRRNVNNILHMQSLSATNPGPGPEIFASGEEPAVEIINANGAAPIVFVCEHASNRVPKYFAALGLSPKQLESHVAWDPGARDIALRLSAAFDAPLVCSGVSRLVYDCNRAPGAASAMRSVSENVMIPGNKDISRREAQARLEQVYHPFARALREAIGKKTGGGASPVLITVHSFTPVYFGQPRHVEIGILHHNDTRLADAMLAEAHHFPRFEFERNMPYGPGDGVTHTLELHGTKPGLANVMIEVRNDLVKTDDGKQRVAATLADMIGRALKHPGIYGQGGGE